MLERLFGIPAHRRSAEALYRLAVDQARSPAFYTSMGVPDTLDGRFDMIAIHVFLILHRLKRAGDAGETTAQSLFDAMFRDMDRCLRELGAGDLGVGRRVKAMAKAFYGRIAAYEEGLGEVDGTLLAAAIRRNLFRGDAAAAGHSASIAAYMRTQAETLALQPIEDILGGTVDFIAADAGHDREAAS